MIVPVVALPFTTTITPEKVLLLAPLTTVPFIVYLVHIIAEAKVKLSKNKTDNNFFHKFYEIKISIFDFCSQLKHCIGTNSPNQPDCNKSKVSSASQEKCEMDIKKNQSDKSWKFPDL